MMGKKMGFIIFAASRLKAGKTATHLVASWSVSPKQQQQQVHKEISLQSNRNVRVGVSQKFDTVCVNTVS